MHEIWLHLIWWRRMSMIMMMKHDLCASEGEFRSEALSNGELAHRKALENNTTRRLHRFTINPTVRYGSWDIFGRELYWGYFIMLKKISSLFPRRHLIRYTFISFLSVSLEISIDKVSWKFGQVLSCSVLLVLISISIQSWLKGEAEKRRRKTETFSHIA